MSWPERISWAAATVVVLFLIVTVVRHRRGRAADRAWERTLRERPPVTRVDGADVHVVSWPSDDERRPSSW